MEKAQKTKKILTLSFNQTYDCFICGTEKGFHIFTSFPFDQAFCRDIGTGIHIIEMLHSSNLLAFVGNGTHPRYPPTKVILWDDHIAKAIGELDFKEHVKALKLRQNTLAVILEHKVYLYKFPELKIFEVLETAQNAAGAFAFSQTKELIAVSLAGKKGEIRIKSYDKELCVEKQAHKSAVACIALSPNAQICATVSVKGTLIRLFSTRNGDQLKELRRGIDNAQVHSVCSVSYTHLTLPTICSV
eukprot:TRINITY_DN5862_c0_g2_i2.p1 TRINITY_DN5862_c0_g2~~TRINITY_DN5862_c0_g2_i2.p1  ORF type:complete len:245 (+),score=62.88 TRINITY_DN5862_c0_g2_i2:58-792(+)